MPAADRCWSLLVRGAVCSPRRCSTMISTARRCSEGKSPSPLAYSRHERNYEFVRGQYFGAIAIADSTPAAADEHRSTIDYHRDRRVNGVAYESLPVVHVTAKWNNTHINTVAAAGDVRYGYTNCKRCGFAHSKKKTDLAGEMTGKAAAELALERGCPAHVRVVLRGLGPGRRPAVRGLQAGGLTVVSITDMTPLHMSTLPQRPRKIRRL